jgi:heptosyltransferase III
MKIGDLPENPRILVVTLRRLGDVLLTTPFIRALKSGCAGCSIDALVFRGTEGMLAGNRDLDDVIAIPQRPSIAETATIIRRLWRRYDLAVSSQTGDRPVLLAWAAGRHRVGFLAGAESGAFWKRRVFDGSVLVESKNHRVVELARLAQCLGLSGRHDIVGPAGIATAAAALPARYAVVHANPMYRIRRWTDDGWRALAQALADRGLTVVATGGPDPAEKEYLDRVWQAATPPIVRRDGALGWPDIAALLRYAAVYVGPDTSVTHLAAGVGTPTVALYGPASPSLIGPWPVGGLETPWARSGTVQHRGNVWVVQNPLPCLPCDKLGCEGHLDSYSRCLDELSVETVLAAVDQALRRRDSVA